MDKFNHYSYCSGNPITYNDPTGLEYNPGANLGVGAGDPRNSGNNYGNSPSGGGSPTTPQKNNNNNSGDKEKKTLGDKINDFKDKIGLKEWEDKVNEKIRANKRIGALNAIAAFLGGKGSKKFQKFMDSHDLWIAKVGSASLVNQATALGINLIDPVKEGYVLVEFTAINDITKNFVALYDFHTPIAFGMAVNISINIEGGTFIGLLPNNLSNKEVADIFGGKSHELNVSFPIEGILGGSISLNKSGRFYGITTGGGPGLPFSQGVSYQKSYSDLIGILNMPPKVTTFTKDWNFSDWKFFK